LIYLEKMKTEVGGAYFKAFADFLPAEPADPEMENLPLAKR
jgi:hypothetical protein